MLPENESEYCPLPEPEAWGPCKADLGNRGRCVALFAHAGDHVPPSADVEEGPRPLTVAEIQLMRALIAWRKEHEIEFVRRRVYGAPYWVDAYRRTAPGRREVWNESGSYGPGTFTMVTDRPHEHYLRTEATSLTQAVDVLVAFGYLPARFSSAYRAGWEAQAADSLYHQPMDSPDVVPLPHNPS